MILAIESSCDESSIALVTEGPCVLAEATASQEDLHKDWGGVVPELAARAHQESLAPLLERVLTEAGCSYGDLKAIAIAHTPGLMGPLLVGTTFAKTLALSLNVPLIGVNHLQGHMASVELENRTMLSSSLGLLVSGGHTLFLKRNPGGWNILGGTRDDAAGEAFDKGARLLGLPYPGGALLAALAEKGDPKRIPFPVSKIEGEQVSFSGLKSELRRRIDKGLLQDERAEDIAAGYQHALLETLLHPLRILLKRHRPECLVLSGGVSRNERLRERLRQEFDLELMMPEPHWCTDNAAMIGAAALERYQRGEADSLALQPSPRINPRELLARDAL